MNESRSSQKLWSFNRSNRRCIPIAQLNPSIDVAVLIEKSHTSPPLSVRIGCAGWNILQPCSANFVSEGSHLQRYAQIFSCCEINSSFYRPHKKETWERWARTVPDGFQFSVKLPRAISHEAKLNCSPPMLPTFLEQIKFLQEKLGPVLVQLPPSLEFDPASARKFLSSLRQNYAGDIVWEPRHVSWFDDRVDELLKEYQIARVAADPACVPEAASPGGLPSMAYFRLHGSPRRYYSAYRSGFLNKLSAQLMRLANTARVWCIFDNTASGSAIQNALELQHKVRQSLARKSA